MIDKAVLASVGCEVFHHFQEVFLENNVERGARLHIFV